jgi:hypothetical protein
MLKKKCVNNFDYQLELLGHGNKKETKETFETLLCNQVTTKKARGRPLKMKSEHIPTKVKLEKLTKDEEVK